jgi:hypothetical protein
LIYIQWRGNVDTTKDKQKTKQARDEKAMTTYKTNHAITTKSMTEWYFGKTFVANMTGKAMRENKKPGKNEKARATRKPAGPVDAKKA